MYPFNLSLKNYPHMKRDSYLVGKAFKSFLLASVLTVSASQMGAFVDGLMLTWFINDKAMSAVNISSPVLQLYFSLCLLLGVGGTLMAGRSIGNHDRPGASRIFSLSVISAVATGVVLGTLGLVFFHPLLNLLCPDAALSGYAGDYLGIITGSAPVYMLMIVLQLFVALDGEPKRVTLAVSVCIAINLILDYLFIAIFSFGIAGAAWATVISYFPAIGILSTHFRKKDTLRFTPHTGISGLNAVIANGAPSGFTAMLMAVQIFACNIIAIHYLGTAGVIVLAVCMYLLRLSMILLTGTIDSFQPVASILAGSQDHRGVSMVLRKAYTFMLAGLAIYAAVMILFPSEIAAIFGVSGDDAFNMARGAIPAFAVNIFLQCAIGLLIPVYQVYSNSKPALVVSIAQPVLPMVFFGIMAIAGADAWWGFAIGQIALLVLLLPMAMSKKGHHIPFFLIPKENADNVYDTSMRPVITDIGTQLMEADTWLDKSGIDNAMRLRIGIACEEILKNIADHSPAVKNAAPSIDMRISLTPGEVRAIIHDAGLPFNPIEEDPHTGLGLLLVKGVCDNIGYEYLFHQNVLTMKWQKNNQTPHE